MKRSAGRRRYRFISALNKRISLTLKMVLLAVIIALVLWGGFDMTQTRKLKQIFQERLNENLGEQAMEDRLNFDRYVKAHQHSAKLFISMRSFGQYIESRNWNSDDEITVKNYRRSPKWFPKSSILRTFVQPRFALLLDDQGMLREVYRGPQNDNLPPSLLNPGKLLLLKSYRQNLMTNIDGEPYVIASDRYLDSSGRTEAILMLASPIDDLFLAVAMGVSMPGHIVALLTPGRDSRILTSSNLDELPADLRLEDLKEQYMVTGKEFFDYGASEQPIKFVSFMSMKEVQNLIRSILFSERQVRIIALPILIASFAFLIFWITRRIQLLTHRISDFSQRMLGFQPKGLQRGDQLFALEERFQSLTEEVIEARDVIKRKADEKLLIEKNNMEIRQKVKQLGLLQSVTQAVGVGVIKKNPYGAEAVNKKMEEFAELCGGISKFDISTSGEFECSLVDKNGDRRIFCISSPDVFDEDICLVRDITREKEQTEALEHMAMHDTLTGLPNRALFQDRLQHAILVGKRDGNSIALLMIDLDRFKEINDTLGHFMGDVVLIEIGKRLPGILRKSDTIARLGGDEFAILLPSVDSNHARETADKVMKSIEEAFVIENNSLYIGASIGIVFFPDHGEDANSLLQRADVAMYVAKNSRCGVAVYSPEDDSHSLHHLVLTGELRCAIENEQLTLNYQPKIDCKTGSICGMEALARWEHPKHGFIPPDEFISIAEYSGLINPLTTLVLNKALCQYREWRKKNKDFKLIISVNLSARNLLDLQFPKEVETLLKKWEVDPACLEFEITESAVMTDTGYALEIIRQLNEMGVRFSIDDFGTGYSSLAHLRKLPVNEIKIDKSFVTNMTNDESDAMIVRSTIDLAHNLGLSVIAEGVETIEMLDMLGKLGCNGAQGYYICRPLPAVEFAEWLKESEWGLGKKNKSSFVNR
ncbi:MAG: EAL domain-containing protein [Nitrospirota bacterium]